MTSAGDLLSLQELDLQHDSRRSLMADIDSRLVETDELISARTGSADMIELVAKLEAKQKQIETQLTDLDARLRPLEARLYDGSVRNPKELTDLQKEVDQLKTKRGDLDDAGLETLEEIEEAGEAKAVAEVGLARVLQDWQRDQDRLRQERSKAEGESKLIEQDRSGRAGGMERAALGLYEALRQSKQGRAVARVERGSCQGCRISLPTNLVGRVRAQETLVQCPSCERILVAG